MSDRSPVTTDTPQPAESSSRARTRRAILDAAAHVLGRDATASLGDVADAAGVGRSTLHRYFPERADLVRALARHVMELSDLAVTKAMPESGDPVEALRRVAESFFDLGPVLMYLYSEPLLAHDQDFWASMTSSEDPLECVFTRTPERFTPALPISWVRKAFWSLLYAGWDAAREDGLARHEVIDAMMTTFTRGVLAEDTRAI